MSKAHFTPSQYLRVMLPSLRANTTTNNFASPLGFAGCRRTRRQRELVLALSQPRSCLPLRPQHYSWSLCLLRLTHPKCARPLSPRMGGLPGVVLTVDDSTTHDGLVRSRGSLYVSLFLLFLLFVYMISFFSLVYNFLLFASCAFWFLLYSTSHNQDVIHVLSLFSAACDLERRNKDQTEVSETRSIKHCFPRLWMDFMYKKMFVVKMAECCRD